MSKLQTHDSRNTPQHYGVYSIEINSGATKLAQLHMRATIQDVSESVAVVAGR